MRIWVSAVLLLIGIAIPVSANLVTNPGFETGNFTGWTVTHAPTGSIIQVDNFGAHSGTYAAGFAARTSGQFDSISQAITTEVGQTYEINAWISNGNNSLSGSLDNEFKMLVENNTYTLLNTGNFSYLQFSVIFTATSTTTTLTFEAYNTVGFFALDDIDVHAVPEPGTLLTAISGVIGLLFVRSRKSFS